MEVAQLAAPTAKSKPAVRFAETSEPLSDSVRTDTLLNRLEQVLRAVLQNQGSQRPTSLNSGRISLIAHIAKTVRLVEILILTSIREIAIFPRTEATLLLLLGIGTPHFRRSEMVPIQIGTGIFPVVGLIMLDRIVIILVTLMASEDHKIFVLLVRIMPPWLTVFTTCWLTGNQIATEMLLEMGQGHCEFLFDLVNQAAWSVVSLDFIPGITNRTSS